MIDFGEVRSAAHEAPSRQGWERLCALCEAATQVEWDEQLQPYLARELERWPTALRELPLRWARQVMERGSAPPCHPLAASLKLVLYKLSWSNTYDLRHLSLLAHPALAALSLRVEGLDAAKLGPRLDVSQLLSSPALGGLRDLELGDLLTQASTLRAVAQNEALRDLEVFGMIGVKLAQHHPDGLSELVAARGVKALRLHSFSGLSRPLGRAPLWRGINSLALISDQPDGGDDPLFGLELPPGQLTSLRLANLHQHAQYHRLLSAPATDALTALSLNLCRQLDLGLVIKRLGELRLRALSWTSCWFEDQGVAQLAGALAADGLLEQTQALEVDERTQQALLDAAPRLTLPALRSLRLRSALKLEQAAALTRLDMPALRRLDVKLYGSDRAEAQQLLAQLREAPWFDQLDALHLDAYLLEPSDLAMLRPGLARRVNIGDPVDPLWDMQGQPLL